MTETVDRYIGILFVTFGVAVGALVTGQLGFW